MPEVEVQPNADGEFQCPDCERRFPRTSALGRHRVTHGYVPLKKRGKPGPHACTDCDRTFTTPQALGYHRSHIHGYESLRAQAKSAPAEAPIQPPPLGALLRIVEMSLDVDENVLVTLDGGGVRWQGVIFGRTQV